MARNLIIDRSQDRHFMAQALALAEAGAALGEVPVGALLVQDGEVIGRGFNCPISTHDPSAHAEMVAIRAAAARLGDYRLAGCDLYVTLEPCPMCAGAISHARIARLYYGAADAKGGGVEHGARVLAHPQCHHRPEVYGGLGEPQAADLLRGFFEGKRR